MSTTYPGHAEWIVARKKKTSTGKIPRDCSCLPRYFKAAKQIYGVGGRGGGGGGKRWISQINTSLSTTYCMVLKNWTLLENAIYHIINVTIVNAFILYNYLVYQAGLNVISEHVWAKHF